MCGNTRITKTKISIKTRKWYLISTTSVTNEGYEEFEMKTRFI